MNENSMHKWENFVCSSQYEIKYFGKNRTAIEEIFAFLIGLELTI